MPQYDPDRTPVTGTHGLLRACAESMSDIDARMHAALMEFRDLNRSTSTLRWQLVLLLLLLIVHVAVELAYVVSHP